MSVSQGDQKRGTVLRDSIYHVSGCQNLYLEPTKKMEMSMIV